MSVTYINVNMYFYRQPVSALVTIHYQALSKNKTLKLQFRMDTLHYTTLQVDTLHYATYK